MITTFLTQTDKNGVKNTYDFIGRVFVMGKAWMNCMYKPREESKPGRSTFLLCSGIGDGQFFVLKGGVRDQCAPK